MSEILSHQEATKAWVLLQQGGVTIDGGMEALDALWFSHEALRARLAEVEAERDNLAMFHRDWYANDLPEMQRLAMWLHPDPNLPLPNLRNLANASIARAEAAEARLAEVERLLLRQTNLNTEAITQRMAAEARLAEVEQALRKYGEHLGSCSYATDHFGIGGRKKADCRPCSCGFAAVLDKGEQTDG